MPRIVPFATRPSSPRRPNPILGPHAIILLLVAATVVLSPGLIPDSDPPSTATAECAVLSAFLGDPDLLAGFEGTEAELQRWVDAYDQHCR